MTASATRPESDIQERTRSINYSILEQVSLFPVVNVDTLGAFQPLVPSR
jgi:hypothetical protein